jgi:hypothetical protein
MPNEFIAKKATVVKHNINPYSPINLENNIRMDTVLAQDDRNQILPIDPAKRNLVTILKG